MIEETSTVREYFFPPLRMVKIMKCDRQYSASKNISYKKVFGRSLAMFIKNLNVIK